MNRILYFTPPPPPAYSTDRPASRSAAGLGGWERVTPALACATVHLVRSVVKSPFHGVDGFVSVCVLYVAVCNTSLVCAVRSVSKTLARESFD